MESVRLLILDKSNEVTCPAAATNCVPWSDWNWNGAPWIAINLLNVIRNASVEYNSAILTCTNDIAVHTRDGKQLVSFLFVFCLCAS